MNNQFSENEILEKISAMFVEALRIDPARVSREARIFNDLDAESLDVLDVRFRIEAAFGFKFEQNELIAILGEGLSDAQIREKFTVGSLVKYVHKRLQRPVMSS